MSTWETAVDVISRCIRLGIREFVVSGGARNAVLLEAVARAEQAGKARVWKHFEERSAGFFALGRTMETGEACAVITTSGTAAAELLPPTIEAYYQARPLVLITADRPTEFRHSGAPQTIDQTNLFGTYADKGVIEDWDGGSPFHWNVELGEEFEPGEDLFSELEASCFQPEEPPPTVAALARWLQQDAYRGCVVAVGALEPQEREEVFHFCREFGAPVIAEATSGLREALAAISIPRPERSLSKKPPGKVLRLGEPPSGRFWRDLENQPEIDVWSVCRNGLPGLARDAQVTQGRVDRVLRALGEAEPADDALDLLAGSSGDAAAIDELLEAYPDSEAGLMRSLSHYASIGSSVFLGNSLPIREWNQFAQWSRPVPNVRANRGANGIDGQISTWLGSSADQDNAWAILGDLTVLYDLSALSLLRQVSGTGRVLAVINNRGGRIFEQLPRLESMHKAAAESLVQEHHVDFSSVAALGKLNYHRIATTEDFDGLETGETSLLLEVCPDAVQSLQFMEKLKHL